MHREIRKKTMTHGLTAVLLAVLLTAVVYNLGVQPFTQPTVVTLRTFSSYEELEDFLKTNIKQAQGFSQQRDFSFFASSGENTFTDLSQEAKAAPAHSTTNVQVTGVDEADYVKTDGEYLYVVSGSNIHILRAWPPEQATVLSKLTLNETYGMEIYVSRNKLAVIGNRQSVYYAYKETLTIAPYWYNPETFVKIYDITDRAHPVLTRSIILNGTLSGSRMIGDYVYSVVNQPSIHPFSNQTHLEVLLPKLSVNEVVEEVQPTEIRYLNVTDVFYYFTTVVAVNAISDVQEPTHETFLTGATGTMYVSRNNLYLTAPNTSFWITPLTTPKEETLIYRVRLDQENIVVEADGSVQGYVLNQFSMDEYNGLFRIATTKGWGDASVNNLYVLNMSLGVVGKLEGLAQGERIYSARFMGDRGYLVTFRQIDPFFVVDLSNPLEPKVLGYLKIPGFSGYLHPYDENNIIGVGRQDNNLKLSLFNVDNVTDPQETAKFIVQGEWSDSTVLTDHKGFLFDRSKQLLAFPVSINWVVVTHDYYDKSFWQGALVFNISLTDGFVLKGNVTHLDNNTYQWDGGNLVKRTLYIDNVLYTVSDRKVKLSSLEDLTEIREIQLP